MSIIENTTAPNVVKDEYFREATPSETGYKSESVSIPVPFVSENQTFDLSARYDSRQTADGRRIVDNFPTFVKKIYGDTVKSINLIPFPYYQMERTVAGITFKANADGSITINGTSTQNNNLRLFLEADGLIDGAHVGNTYTLYLIGTPGYQVYCNLIYIAEGASAYSAMANTEAANLKTFTMKKGTNLILDLHVHANYTANNLTVYPMIVEGSYTSSTMPAYQPYFKDLKNAYINNIVSVGRNLIPFPYGLLGGIGATITKNAVTCTVQNDEGIKISGTPTVNTYINLHAMDSKYTQAGGFWVTGASGTNGQYTLSKIADSSVGLVISIGSNNNILCLYLYANTAYDCTVYPMLVKGSYTASTMPPYQNYVTDTYQLNSSVELGKYDYIDVVRKKLVRQTKTIALTGNEFWGTSTTSTQGKRRFALYLQESNLPIVLLTSSLICNDYPTVSNDDTWFNVTGVSTISNSNYIYIYDEATAPMTAADFRAHVKSLYDAGTPIIISYCAKDILSEEDIEVPETYFVWNKGSETIHQGEIDNSVYGALIEVDQTYVESYTMPLVVTQKSYTNYTVENGQITIHYPNESKTYFAQKVIGSNDD